MLNNLKIVYRLSIGFGLLVLILILLAVFALNRMNVLARQTALMHDHPLTVSNAVLRINTNIIRIHRNMKDVALARSNASIEIASRSVDKCEEEIYKDFEIVNMQFLGEKEKYKQAFEVFADWKVIRDEVISLMSAGENIEAANITKGKGAIHVIHIEKDMEALTESAQSKAKEIYNNALTVEQESLKMMYLIFGISLVLVIGFAVIFTRSITTPISRLTHVAESIAKGDLAHEIDISNKDEIGQLASSFNTMMHSLDQAQKKLVRKEKFATIGRISGSIAHDIRHPLATIKNSAYFLNMTLKDPNEKTKKHLKLIDSEVAYANEIITSLMRLSESKEPEKSKINIDEFSNEFFSAFHLPEHIKLITGFDKKCPDILVDRSHLKLILTNLVSNATQAMSNDGTLTIKTRHLSSVNSHLKKEKQMTNDQEPMTKFDFVEISIADTGSGIKKDVLDKVFEPFYTTRSKGIGLGLSIVKDVITANDGNISVESEEGKGSAFKIVFPAVSTG